MDNSIKPGDDFYRYANGGWLRANTIPDGQSRYDTRAMLAEKTSQQVRDLIRNAASAHAATGTVVQKVGDYYASFLDQDAVEVKGLSPVAGEIARIAAITDKTSLSAVQNSSHLIASIGSCSALQKATRGSHLCALRCR